MTRREFIRHATARLTPRYGEREAASIAQLIAETLCGFTRAQAALDPGATIGGEKEGLHAMQEVAAGRPVQYALGRAWFAGLELEVNENVLIPRPETEELVEWIASKHSGTPAILDIGTGSGAIAIALALKIPGAQVTAIDISDGALEVAARNALKYNAKINFANADILSGWPAGQYDIVVSNPPYIPAGERASMAGHVVDHEPGAALFVPDDDPLLFYRAIARADLLQPGGWLYFEVHDHCAQAVCDLLRGEDFADVELRRDMNDKPRMVRCRKK